jgi:hypothetical protein
VLKKPVFKFTKSAYDRQALKKLKKNARLYQTLMDTIKLSESTGCSYYDYWTLYNTTRNNKPAEILECGTGVSSVVMAYALMENEQEGSLPGRITSMEDVDLWYQKARKLIPDTLKPYVEIVHSPKVEYCHSIFRGVGYQDIPQRAYEFVFIMWSKMPINRFPPSSISAQQPVMFFKNYSELTKSNLMPAVIYVLWGR